MNPPSALLKLHVHRCLPTQKALMRLRTKLLSYVRARICPDPLVCMQVVLVVDQSLQRQQQWDEACSKHGVAFYSAAARGTCTYLFANLHLHTFAPLVSFMQGNIAV